MAQRIRTVIDSTCDVCAHEEGDSNAEAHWSRTIGIDNDGLRRQLELCDKHSEQKRTPDEVIDLFLAYGHIPQDEIAAPRRRGRPRIHPLPPQPERVSPLSCPICGKEYIEQSYLDGHILARHRGGGEFVCDQPGCTRRFAISQALGTHKFKTHGIPGTARRPHRDAQVS